MKRTTQTVRPTETSPPSKLEKGQVWRMGEIYVQITDAGKRLVHYKLAKTLKQRGLRKHLASIETVQAFLESNRAEKLVDPDGATPQPGLKE